MTTASTTTTTAEVNIAARRRKAGLWSSLTSVTTSLANVVGDIADVGSEASRGLKHQAQAYRLGVVRDMVEEFGTIEEIKTLNALSEELNQKL